LERVLQFLGHSALLWYLISHMNYQNHQYVLCLQALQNCLRDLEGMVEGRELSIRVWK